MTTVSPRGYLQILNGTPYTFTNTDPSDHGYQLTSWNPAASIAPGTLLFLSRARDSKPQLILDLTTKRHL